MDKAKFIRLLQSYDADFDYISEAEIDEALQMIAESTFPTDAANIHAIGLVYEAYNRANTK